MHSKNLKTNRVPRKKVITFRINPQTHVRATKGDSILFRIPQDQLRPDGLKRKLRLVQYNEYKKDLRLIAEYLNFTMPASCHRFTFYIPVPKSWRPGKKVKHHNQPHLNKPDADNLIKAMKDALLPKSDSGVWDFRVTKYWTNSSEGRIEVSRTSIR